MEEKHVDKVVNIKLEDEMKSSFIGYAMSVIASRALPDVRDGLKPVHRRILYAMNELNLQPNKAYKKSARIVGDTMGKYHPHGDSSIYDAMVRMAQEFSMRYPLVDGHGNFGSIDGDSAAAQRYTEARISYIAAEMLSDIDKNTVDFVPNYDEEFFEPSVLPAKFPNLLVNGTAGIAVGMATNIPPHNLTEVIDGVVKMIDNYNQENRETDIEELIDIIKGPDFPTSANILGVNGIRSAYRTGKGKIIVRSTVEIENLNNGRDMIVIKEIPYQVNKSRLVEKIGELVRDKKVEGIYDLRDESNRHGIRVVIELKKDANSSVILNNLYKYSQLQDTFSINMLALVNNEPKTLNLKEILEHYINHQIEVITRRTQFDLDRALKRSHILQGYLIALDNIDEVISIIRSSSDTNTAKSRLIDRFGLSEEQSTAIVEMRLRSLTGLERNKIENEFNKLQILITELKSILENKNKMYSIIKEELITLRNKYLSERRTNILPNFADIDYEDLIEDEMCVITMTNLGYIKRLPLTTYKSQNRGGRGIMGMQTREEDVVKNLFVTNTHSYLLYFTNKGKVFMNKVYEIPEAMRNAKGTALINQINLSVGEKVTAIIPMKMFNNDDYFVMITKYGLVKKTSLSAFKNINKAGLIALTIREDDELITVLKTDGKKDIFIATKDGMGIKFNESNVRSMGRTAAGVRGIKLRKGDYVVGSEVLEDNFKVLLVSESGYGKCTETNQFNLQKRGGMGLKIYKITPKTGNLVGICLVSENEELMLINSQGIIIRIRTSDISTLGRITQGVKLINLDEDVKVISIAKIAEDQMVENIIED